MRRTILGLGLTAALAASAGEPKCPRDQVWSVERDSITRKKTGQGCTTKTDGGRDLREGKWVFYFASGKKESEATYVAGKKEGVATWYWENGRKKSQYTYRADQMNGPSTTWNERGVKTSEQEYKDDNLVAP